MSELALVSTADTELLAAKAAGRPWRVANPARLAAADVAGFLRGADAVVVRLLGGAQAWREGLAALLASGVPAVVLGGESAPDAELMASSTVPQGVAAEALRYLSEGGPANLAQLHRFLCDTLLLTGEGFDPPVPMPEFGRRTHPAPPGDGPTVGIVYYRAHELSGNTGFVDALADAVAAGGGRPLPVFCASLRAAPAELVELLRPADAVVVTVLAAGGATPAAVAEWDAGALAGLDVTLLQGLCVTTSRATWAASGAGLTPVDAAMQVAVPEFDGRVVGVPFSFKETGPDGVPVYAADPERTERLAGIALAHARLRRAPNPDKRVAVLLSSYPTRHARVGNAVGLDTPASALVLLRAMRSAGYRVDAFPEDGDALVHSLIAAGGYDTEWLTDAQLAAAAARMPLDAYRARFDRLPGQLRAAVVRHWGEPPGELYVDRGEIVVAALRYGNVVLAIQPPRGFGENPVAIYHDPELPPSHHYLAAYWWLADAFRADALVHLGKHGTLEWLPGKGLGLSAGCAPDATGGELPLVYPFIVNDPGEGVQAKRRAHAVVVDHLIPPLARAETYGELARLEQLLDEHAAVAALDPAKLPAVRAQIWSLVQGASLHRDLGLDDRPTDDEFDEFCLHVDGYLCEVKDAQIRDGLHILGAAPTGGARVNLLLAMLRARQLWGGAGGALPGLREALGLVEGKGGRAETDSFEQAARELVESMESAGWDPAAADRVGPNESVRELLRFAATELVPRLAATRGEVDAVLHALSGGFVPPGPSGSPTRGLGGVLPTGRNFYSVDPKAIPSPLAYQTGCALAESLVERYRADTGAFPRSVGLTVWGTSAMRTQGDDIGEVLALLGVRPVWDEASRRVTGLRVRSVAELGRPRVDVTVRISGFFRDAFPGVVDLIDEAVALVADLDELPADNPLRAHVAQDVAAHGDLCRATTRIFGSKPGAYGAGLLPLIDARNWRSDADLAEVYAVWGGYAYGRGLAGRPAREDMERVFRRVQVAAKNQDNREHDIVDSDDYFQYHGGMVAAIRHLTGAAPAAYVGDSHMPDAVRTRTLGEETRRVFRSRVVNPRWIAAMMRHGYKGAFEMAATVDYLFGFDATAGVVDDWMYESLAARYVFDEAVSEFMRRSNPWARRAVAERLLEAADRGLWAAPERETLAGLREAYLAAEADLEGAE